MVKFWLDWLGVGKLPVKALFRAKSPYNMGEDRD